MDFGDALRLAADQVLQDFAQHGRHVFDRPLDAAAAGRLLDALKAERRYDEGLFLSEAEFDADPQHRGVNPRPGRNLLERFSHELSFVEDAPSVRAAVSALLGTDYEILDRKAVCGVPARSIPAWLKARIAGNPVNNLGAYVRPEYRDVTYFYGIDFHQDLIDHRGREADFVTLYVYLHPVGASDAPLFLLEGSHALGAAVFPHDLEKTGPGVWRYRNGVHGEVETRQRVLTGPAGHAAMWHACTLHGTQPDEADEERISLRYLLGRRPGSAAGIDMVNAHLRGPLALADTRVDLGADGSAAVKGNIVNRA